MGDTRYRERGAAAAARPLPDMSMLMPIIPPPPAACPWCVPLGVRAMVDATEPARARMAALPWAGCVRVIWRMEGEKEASAGALLLRRAPPVPEPEPLLVVLPALETVSFMATITWCRGGCATAAAWAWAWALGEARMMCMGGEEAEATVG